MEDPAGVRSFRCDVRLEDASVRAGGFAKDLEDGLNVKVDRADLKDIILWSPGSPTDQTEQTSP